ncbi:TAP-like protein [Rhizoctonia solani]|uniref:TAP-like protein n=1 Tax=Rhizoctonia solani TaxID=456999 RepID=A0A8H7ICL4_9AGAM|nr:TAP-like protein [Rhizoctonia solani]
MNPGGPGGSGLQTVQGPDGDVIMEHAGGNYDLVSWDPRGVGQTVPRTACFETKAEEDAFWNGSILKAFRLEVRGNFTSQTDLDAFYSKLNESDTLAQRIGEQCVTHSPNTFQYIGTAATVRDMVAMHDVLEGSEKINFWGMSYGTVVGAYFVNMFPDRVGRVILDGVVDPVYWANRPAHEWLGNVFESTEAAFDGFAKECAMRALLIVLSRSKTLPHPAFFEHNQAKRWLQLPDSIDPIDNKLRPRQEPTSDETNLAYAYDYEGIACGDAQDPGDATTKDVFDIVVNVTHRISPTFGPAGVERLSNEADPVTPYLNAKSVADAFGGSAVLIEQAGYGHVSRRMPSNCTISAVQKYLIHNELPNRTISASTKLFVEPLNATSISNTLQ